MGAGASTSMAFTSGSEGEALIPTAAAKECLIRSWSVRRRSRLHGIRLLYDECGAAQGEHPQKLEVGEYGAGAG